MTIAKNKVVSIDYILTDEKNDVLDSTSGQKPLDYLHGFGNIIPGLEKALEGRSRGERFSACIPAAEAYGERDERLITELPLETFREAGAVKPGMRFHIRSDEEEGGRLFTVTKVADNKVFVDGNHPLASKNLNFDVTVTGVREASAEELSHGHAHAHGGCHREGCGSGKEGCGGHGDHCQGGCRGH
jgi:FKBP-type peptidyl-prolyl cis-trans isomerase SlyD